MRKVRTPEPEGFAEFWAIWQPYARRTDGRFDARDGYRKHILEGAEPTDIIDGARWFIRDWATLPVEKQEFIPLAKSWLNKGAYVDFCEKERAFQARQSQQQANVVPMTQPRGQTAFLRQWEQMKAKQG